MTSPFIYLDIISCFAKVFNEIKNQSLLGIDFIV